MIVGAAITVIAPRSPRRAFDDLVFLRAYVTNTAPHSLDWRCGSRTGSCLADNEGMSWIYGHGPNARATLRAARAL